jgi:hypothetical protein
VVEESWKIKGEVGREAFALLPLSSPFIFSLYLLPLPAVLPYSQIATLFLAF